ncbi:MAG: type VI secretion system baseplate subunit TssK [Phycisphaerae bacterium]|nr:type VI secretion system baseplate subunit TssK [Phycisphaerae bacterium]
MTLQVHWHEGLFLRPHHLQAMQRQSLQRAAAERRMAWPHPWGVVDARVSSDELENMRVRFDRLTVIMPSGVEVSVPENADLPSLDISERFAASTRPLTVSLAVPLWQPTRGNALEIGESDWRVKRLYRIEESELPDENTGENEQAVFVRRVNARLILDGDDTTDLETVPLMRIVHGSGDDAGTPRLDASFIPPCMMLSGSPTLRDTLRDLANQVEASRKEQVVQLTRAGFNVETLTGVRVQQFLRLQTLNHYAARLMPMLQAAGGISPFEVYLELRGLQAELSTLQPDRDQFEAPRYDHETQGIVFGELCERIRPMLRGEDQGTWGKAVFDMREGVYETRMSEEQLTRPNEFFLGIQTGRDPRELAKLVENADEFKFIASSMARTRVRGVRLEEERHPPLALPSKVGLHYFRVRRADSQRMWDKIAQEKAIAINFDGIENAGFDSVTLYMTFPD